MKVGFRTPSLKRSIKARTTGKVKRAVKKSINPLYGKKGVGLITNPKKSAYNKVYSKTTFGISDLVSGLASSTKPKDNVNGTNKTTMNNDNDGIMFCTKCGSKVNKEDKFCTKCGKDLIDDDQKRLDAIKEDYRKTIFFYAENTATKVKNKKDYVGYISYECNITNPDIYHKQLIDEGYYEEASVEDVLKNKKIAEIKELVKEKGLSATGKKDDLIAKLVTNLSQEEISSMTKEFYSLSEKGKQFLEDNQNYVNLHCYKDYQITLEDYYHATKNDEYKRKFNDIAWQIFNERTLLYQKNCEYTNTRYNYFHMANLLMREGKNEHALQLYLYCLVIDLSGVESLSSIDSYKSGWLTKADFLENLENIWLIPSLIEQINDLKCYYDEKILMKAYSTMSAYLPFNVSSIEFINDLLDNAFNTPVFDVKKYETILIENKKKQYLKMI